MSLCKVTKKRGSFPNDESMRKLLYLALNNIAKKWTADQGLEGDLEPFCHLVWRQNASLLKTRKPKAAYTKLFTGSDMLTLIKEISRTVSLRCC